MDATGNVKLIGEIPPPGAAVEIAPQVRWLRMPLPFALDHINLWLLEGADGFTIVDAGFALPQVQAAWEAVLTGIERPVRRVLVTHFHPDHLGLAAWLVEKTGAELLMTAGEYLTGWAVWAQAAGHGVPDMLRFFRRHGLGEAPIAALESRGNAYRKGVPALADRYRRLREGDRLRLTGDDWVVQVGHGHAPEHAALYCAEAGVLISGDMLLPRITTNISVFAVSPEADSLQDYLGSLSRWKSLSAATLVLPSHGRPFHGASARVAALEEHHEARLAEVLDACGGTARSAAELLPVLFDRALDAHQTMFAMGEAIAHLNYLEHAGRIGRQTGADGVIRYQRTMQ
jgi:glyoxylase-like metal-dependent hydrolase (beta-lactamase superfamily II)